VADELVVKTERADERGRRTVITCYKGKRHKDCFEVDSGFQRQHWRERVSRELDITGEYNPCSTEAQDEAAIHETLEARLQAAVAAADAAESTPLYVPNVVCMADVAPLAVEWTWDGYIPQGALTVIDGVMGEGKSTWATDIIARKSRGDAMPPQSAPDGTYDPTNSLILSPEDDAARTVRPRLDAAGADVKRVFLMQAMNYVDGDEEREIRLPLDTDAMREAIRKHKARQVVIDPLTAHLGDKINTNSDSSVRQALMPLAKLAQQEQCAILLIRHLSKKQGQSAINSGLGSVGIIATCRAGFLIGRDPENPDQFVMACSKMNLAKKPPSLAFSVVEARGSSRIKWAGAVEVSADQLVHKGERQMGSKLKQAKDLIHEILSQGARGSSEVEGAMHDAGISRSTYWSARKELGVKAQKTDFEGNWLLSLPSVNGYAHQEF
jgi:hypothetical protein